MQVTLSPEYPERFRHALVGLGVGNDDRLMLAVSGGPDSMALLVLAQQWAADRLLVATVDHGLRPESSDEAGYVRQVCQDLGVPHITLAPAEAIKGNIQSSARAARYRLLDDAADQHGCAHIATAHHADDQLETLLMRLARGSGVGGMAGIRTQNGRVIRPLLDFRKSELEDICETAAIRPVRDPSNENTDFDRVAIRQWLARSGHPFDLTATSRTASALADADVALEWVTGYFAAQRISNGEAEIRLDNGSLPKEIARRLLLRALQRSDPAITPRGEAVERLLIDLQAGKTVTIGDILCRGGDIWRFSPAPPRRAAG